ncbi:hypothetical protein SALBM135S_03004 [Streptomyces alboniger]
MVKPAMVVFDAEVEAEDFEVGDVELMPLDPLVMSGPEAPSEFMATMRKISPKPRVTMAR